MKKITIDRDARETIRRSPEATTSTLDIYSALREIAAESDSCDFETKLATIQKKSLASRRTTIRALDFMERRLIITRARTGHGMRVRLLKVAKS